MPSLGNTPRPAYVYDTETDTWVPIGVGAHTHEYIPNTLVDAKGDLITATANDVPARLAKGADGTVLVSDSTTSTGLAWQPYAAPFVAGKNKFINGDFNINQRGLTSTTTSAIYGFDRWQWSLAGSTTGTATMSAETFTPGAAPVAGYEGANYLRITTTGQTTPDTLTLFRQHIEDVRTFAGQNITISFWAKAATGTPKVAVSLVQRFGSGGSPSSNAEAPAGFVTISNSWARYSLTYAMPSITGKTIGTTPNTSDVRVQFFVSAGSTYAINSSNIGIQSNTFDFWGMQIESGNIATPFTTATGTIQGELAACQRYYWRDVYGYIASGIASSTTVCKLNVPFPVTMRVTPHTFDYSGLGVQDGVNYYTNGTWGLAGNGSRSSGQVTYTHGAASLVQYRPYFLGWNDANTYLGFSAEL